MGTGLGAEAPSVVREAQGQPGWAQLCTPEGATRRSCPGCERVWRTWAVHVTSCSSNVFTQGSLVRGGGGTRRQEGRKRISTYDRSATYAFKSLQAGGLTGP